MILVLSFRMNCPFFFGAKVNSITAVNNYMVHAYIPVPTMNGSLGRSLPQYSILPPVPASIST